MKYEESAWMKPKHRAIRVKRFYSWVDNIVYFQEVEVPDIEWPLPEKVMKMIKVETLHLLRKRVRETKKEKI